MLSTPGRGKNNLAHLVAMGLARKLGEYDLKAVAAAFHLSHYSSVSVAVSRLRALMREDGQLRKKVEDIRRNCTKT